MTINVDVEDDKVIVTIRNPMNDLFTKVTLSAQETQLLENSLKLARKIVQPVNPSPRKEF
jgi:hypothetical protein